jgi:hypothetical protein
MARDEHDPFAAALGSRRGAPRPPDAPTVPALLLAAVEELSLRLPALVEAHLRFEENRSLPVPENQLRALAATLGPLRFNVRQDGPARFFLTVEDVFCEADIAFFDGDYEEDVPLGFDVFWSEVALKEPLPLRDLNVVRQDR